MIDPTRLEPIESQIFVEERPDSKPFFCDAFRRSKLLGLFVKDFGIGQGSRACANQEGTWLTAHPFVFIVQVFLKCSGGGSGIRTRDTVSRIHTFQACAFNHSATPPFWCLRRTRSLWFETVALKATWCAFNHSATSFVLVLKAHAKP